MTDRPTLVTIIAVLTFLAALVILVAGAALAFISEDTWIDFVASYSGDLSGITLNTIHVMGYGAIIGGLITFVIGYALWKGWTIAWYLGIILFGISAVGSIASMFVGAYFSIVGLVIALVIIYYLFRPAVKEFFKV